MNSPLSQNRKELTPLTNGWPKFVVYQRVSKALQKGEYLNGVLEARTDSEKFQLVAMPLLLVFGISIPGK